MKVYKIAVSLMILLFVVSYYACDGGNEKGSLSLYLADATTDDYKAVYVTVKEVRLKMPTTNDEEAGEETGNGDNGEETSSKIAVKNDDDDERQSTESPHRHFTFHHLRDFFDDVRSSRACRAGLHFRHEGDPRRKHAGDKDAAGLACGRGVRHDATEAD